MSESARPEATTSGRASRDAFVSSTAKLLRRQGYAATGLNEIVARSGAPRGSLYFHFPGGKQELALAAMEHSGEQLRGAIAAVMASPGGAARTVGGLIDALAAGLEASGYRDGCPIATVTLEQAGASESLRLTAERVFSSWLCELESALVAEGAKPGAARSRATMVLAAAEGGLLLARARRDTAPLMAVKDELQTLLA
jgi:TetR/AcrR family transcriptional regulator, lmrAB and yxaGH operons repressor